MEKINLAEKLALFSTHWDPKIIADSLTRQLMEPVQWIKVIRGMMEEGFSTFVEVGPGKVLSGLIGKISKDAKVLNAGDIASVEALPGLLKSLN